MPNGHDAHRPVVAKHFLHVVDEVGLVPVRVRRAQGLAQLHVRLTSLACGYASHHKPKSSALPRMAIAYMTHRPLLPEFFVPEKLLVHAVVLLLLLLLGQRPVAGFFLESADAFWLDS